MSISLPVARIATAPAQLPTYRERRLIRLCFLTIYLVWGVSYPVARIVATHLPPLLATGARFCFAATVLTGVVYCSGLTLPTRARDWRLAGAAAFLGIVVSNGLNILALREVASNQVALVSASSAFWIAWLGTYGRRPSPVSKRTWIGLIVGFAGLSILVSAHGFGEPAHLGWLLLVLGGALSWALATAVIRESQPDCDPLAFTAAYLLIGGVMLAILGLATGDASRWSWSPSGLAAMVFLAVFSSTLAFLAYTYLLRHETPARIGTYAYISPLVAVVTGWLLLDERLNAAQLAGMVVIYAGLIMVRKLHIFQRPRRRHANG